MSIEFHNGSATLSLRIRIVSWQWHQGFQPLIACANEAVSRKACDTESNPGGMMSTFLERGQLANIRKPFDFTLKFNRLLLVPYTK